MRAGSDGKPLFGVEDWYENFPVCCWLDNGCHQHSAVLGRCYVLLPSVVGPRCQRCRSHSSLKQHWCNFECIRLVVFYSVIFQSVIFQSCNFHPCDFVRHFSVLQIPVLQIQLSHFKRQWFSYRKCEIEIHWRKTNIPFGVIWWSPPLVSVPTRLPSPSIPYTVHVSNNTAGARRVTRFALEKCRMYKCRSSHFPRFC